MEGEIKRLKDELLDVSSELDKMQEYLLNQDRFYRCSFCKNVRSNEELVTCSAGHLLCEYDTEWVGNGIEDKCAKCTKIRNKSAKKSIVALLLCLKQNDCHIYLFIPLLKLVYQNAWCYVEWNKK